MDKIFTSTDCENKEFNDDERSFVAYASKEVVDRDGEIIKTDAWQLKDFDKNPIIMLFHDHKTLPVGRAAWVKTTPDGLKFKPIFAKTARGEEVYQLYKEGILNAFSVGFQPLEWEDSSEKGVNRVYTKASLHEISCVNVPSCPDALVERVHSGGIKTKSLAKELEEVLPVKEVEINKDVEETKSEDEKEKNTSLGGIPSIFDIMDKIRFALGNTPDGVGMVHIVDVFPNTSTSGSCVVEFDNTINETRSKYWHYDYNYNPETETVTVSNPVAVEEIYVRKSIDKAGRELSGRNVTLLKNVSGKMRESSDMIDGLVEGKDADIDSKEKEPDIIEIKKDDTEEKIQKDDTISIEDVKNIISKGFEKAKPVDINIVVQDEIKRLMGVLD